MLDGAKADYDERKAKKGENVAPRAGFNIFAAKDEAAQHGIHFG